MGTSRKHGELDMEEKVHVALVTLYQYKYLIVP